MESPKRQFQYLISIVDTKKVYLCSKNQPNELLTPTATMDDHSAFLLHNT